MTDPLLSLSGIDTYYGPVQVLFGLALEVPRGQIVCLLGGNASGKSTTMKVILGLLHPRAGQVKFDGADITLLPTPQIIRRGIGSVPEARRLFATMTVRENLLMGAYARNDRKLVAQDLQRMLELFPRVAERIDFQAGTLPTPRRITAGVGRPVMSAPSNITVPALGRSSPRITFIVVDLDRKSVV